MTNLLASAKWYLNHGLNIVACDNNKMALVKWKPYQSTMITEAEINTQLAMTNAVGLSIICGQISGNLEVVDVDLKHDNSGTLMDRLIIALADIYPKLYVVKTVSGGYHLYYRCEVIEGNQQLANTSENLVIIETRGEGGYVVGPPTNNYKRIQGTEIPVVTIDERDFILNTCRSFNELEFKPFIIPTDSATDKKFDLSPSDDYNKRADIGNLLQECGWTISSENADQILYKRPGSDPAKKSQSANLRRADNIFYVFSSSSNLKPGYYTPFALYTFLKCNGDFKESASQLVRQGYGTRKLMHVVTEKSHKLDLAAEALAAHWDIRKNVITEQIEMKKRSDKNYSNINIATLYWWLNAQAGIKITFADVKAVIDGGHPIEFDPFLQYFQSLEYDPSEDWISLLAGHVRMETDQAQNFWYDMFKKAIVRMVPQALGRDINRVLMVLQGDKQKTGKSTFIRFLNPFNNLYYTEAKITGNEKDVSIRLTENFIYNIEELEGIHRKEMGFIKSMLSTQFCKDRRPHAVYEVGRMRRVNFWGSTNPREILQDTENTRWLIFPVQSIEWSYKHDIDINKVWAQAYHLYQSGTFNYDLTGSEASIQASTNEEFGTVKPEEELIAQWFIPGTEDEHFMTATEICHLLSRKYDRIRLSPFNIGRALKRVFNMKSVLRRNGNVVSRGYKLISKIPTL